MMTLMNERNTHPLVQAVEYLANCPEPTPQWLVFLNEEQCDRLELKLPDARMMLDHLYSILAVRAATYPRAVS